MSESPATTLALVGIGPAGTERGPRALVLLHRRGQGGRELREELRSSLLGVHGQISSNFLIES